MATDPSLQAIARETAEKVWAIMLSSKPGARDGLQPLIEAALVRYGEAIAGRFALTCSWDEVNALVAELGSQAPSGDRSDPR